MENNNHCHRRYRRKRIVFPLLSKSKTRYYGIKVLKLVEQFDQAVYNVTDSATDTSSGTKQHSRSSSKFAADVGTRLIHILEDLDFVELIQPYRKELSVPERTRLTKLKNKRTF